MTFEEARRKGLIWLCDIFGVAAVAPVYNMTPEKVKQIIKGEEIKK